MRFIKPAHPILACLMVIASTCAMAGPDYACMQVGDVKAAPPFIPEGFRIHECSSFSGGADAAKVGKLWCEQAGKAILGPTASAPQVSTVDACPTGAVARCVAPMPGSSIIMSRYHYLADAGAGGIEGLRAACEGRKRKDPNAVFTKF